MPGERKEKKTKTEVPTLDFLIAYFPDRCDTGTHETRSISEKVAASRCAKNAGSRGGYTESA